MQHLRDDIMDLLPDERLPYALAVIDALTGVSTYASVMREYGLTKNQAVVYSVLKRNAGRVITQESLHTAIYGGISDTEIGVIKTMMCQIRKKVPDTITTVVCIGYCLEKQTIERAA